MKKLLVLAFFLITISASLSAQLRIEVKGTIIVEGNDLQGITIYNVSSSKGTVSDVNGKFDINVAVNDTLQVRALQYQDFDLVVNASIVKSRSLKIFLIEEINQLDEILLRDRKVTGNLRTDINAVKTFRPKMDAIYFGVQRERELNESPRDFTRNDATIANLTNQNKPLVNGLDLVNVVDQLLLPLFRSEVDDKKKVGVPEVPAESIKYYFGSEFLNSNFNIPKYRVEEFIRFVEREDDFDFTLLNYGRELEFLELLNKKSIEFLKKPKTQKE